MVLAQRRIRIILLRLFFAIKEKSRIFAAELRSNQRS